MRAVLIHENGMYFAGEDGHCDQCGRAGCPWDASVRDIANAYVFDTEERADETRGDLASDGWSIQGTVDGPSEYERAVSKADAAYERVSTSPAYSNATPKQLAELRERTRFAARLSRNFLPE